MKKIIAFTLLLALLLCGCQSAPDTAGNTEATKNTSAAEKVDTQTPVQTDPEVTDDTCTHADSNSDTTCDNCGESVLVTFEIYSVNDLHGKITDGDNQPGVDEMTTYIKQRRAENENLILVSAGDMWQGSAESNLTKGNLTTEWMNDIGFAAMVMGNHEYDWGSTYVEANSELANFPFLAINIYERATNQRISYCEASTMIDQNGIQIGIIGAVGDCYSSISASQVQDIYFKTGDDLTALVKAESEALRAQGADFIIYAIHDGYESGSSGVKNVTAGDLDFYYDTSLSNGYVDVVFEAHTHQYYILQDEHGVYHLQGGGENRRGMSYVEVTFNSVTGACVDLSASHLSDSTYSSLEDDPIVNDLLNLYAAQVNRGDMIAGYNARQRSSGELQQLVADLYYDVGMELWGEEYDIALGGGFISVRSPYNLSSGEVNYGMIQTLFPFDNQLHLCSIKGRDLKEKFFETDNDRYFIAYGQYGESIRRNIDPDATYYIVVDSYTSDYRYNNLTVVERHDPNVFARDLLFDYIATGAFEN